MNRVLQYFIQILILCIQMFLFKQTWTFSDTYLSQLQTQIVLAYVLTCLLNSNTTYSS